jgi:hypothetical protein
MLHFAILLINMMCINTVPVAGFAGLASLGRMFSKNPFKKLKGNPFKKIGNPFKKVKSKFSRKSKKGNAPAGSNAGGSGDLATVPTKAKMSKTDKLNVVGAGASIVGGGAMVASAMNGPPSGGGAKVGKSGEEGSDMNASQAEEEFGGNSSEAGKQNTQFLDAQERFNGNTSEARFDDTQFLDAQEQFDGNTSGFRQQQ